MRFSIDLCLFDEAGSRARRSASVCRSGPATCSTAGSPVSLLGPATDCGPRAPYEPRAGHRFNPAKLLVDPYGLELDRPVRVLHPSMFGFVPGPRRPPIRPTAHPSCQRPCSPRRPQPSHGPARPSWAATSIAELHIRGFSALHPGIATPIRGHLGGPSPRRPPSTISSSSASRPSRSCRPPPGRTSVISARSASPMPGGYNPIAMMAPESAPRAGGVGPRSARLSTRSTAPASRCCSTSFYNHSGEGDELGPTLSFRGLDNATYYRLDPSNPAAYVNDAGCGNILAADRLPVVRLVLDALRAWARFGGLNGFRFDLMTTLRPPPERLRGLSSDHRGDRTGPAAARPEARGRAMGHRARRLPGRRVRRSLGRNGNDRYRDDIRRFLARATAPRPPWRRGWPGRATCSGPSGDRPARSISSAPMMASRSPIWCPTSASTTSPTASRTATAPTATGPGTMGSKDRPTMPRSSPRGRRDQLNLLATLILSRGTPMLGLRHRGRPVAGRQQQRLCAGQCDAVDRLVEAGSRGSPTSSAPSSVCAKLIRPWETIISSRGQPRPEGDLRPCPTLAWTLPDGRTPAADDWNHPATAGADRHLLRSRRRCRRRSRHARPHYKMRAPTP